MKLQINKIATIFLLLFILIASSSFAQKLPDPVGYVNDFARVVSSDISQQITAICTEVETKTSAQIAVVTIPSLENYSIEEYAVLLFEKWGIGARGKDNGILILNTIEDRKIRIEVGYGLEGIIPDGKAGRIRDQHLIPYLKTAEYGRAYLSAVQAIAGEIANEYGVELSGGVTPIRGEDQGSGAGKLITILILIFLVFITRGRILPWLFLGAMLGGGGRSRGGFGGGGGFSGGFGGFGGGMSGGGGASGSY